MATEMDKVRALKKITRDFEALHAKFMGALKTAAAFRDSEEKQAA